MIHRLFPYHLRPFLLYLHLARADAHPADLRFRTFQSMLECQLEPSEQARQHAVVLAQLLMPLGVPRAQ